MGLLILVVKGRTERVCVRSLCWMGVGITETETEEVWCPRCRLQEYHTNDITA